MSSRVSASKQVSTMYVKHAMSLDALYDDPLGPRGQVSKSVLLAECSQQMQNYVVSTKLADFGSA